MHTNFTIGLNKIISEFSLEVLNMPLTDKEILVSSNEINRPGLQMAGYFEFFDKHRDLFKKKQIQKNKVEQTMTQYQKGSLVMNYLRELGTESGEILDAICDENLEKSYQVIQENPKISKNEFLTKLDIQEE